MRGEKEKRPVCFGKIAVGILRSEAALSLNFRTEPRLGTARESIPRLSVMPLSLGAWYRSSAAPAVGAYDPGFLTLC